MSLLANYIVFMTFFPASLALILEVCPHNPSNMTWHIDQLARAMQEEESKKRPNPVVQRVKIIMAMGLVVVHIHSRLLSQVTGVSLSLSPSSTSPAVISSNNPNSNYEEVPLQDYLRWKIFNFSLDQITAIGLGFLFLLKYIFYDKQGISTTPKLSSSSLKSSSYPSIDGDITTAYFHKRSISINPVPSVFDDKKSNNLRKDSGIEMDAKPTVSVGTQTDMGFTIGNGCLSDIDSEEDEIEPLNIVDRDPRPVEECLAILNGENGPSLLSDEELLSLVEAKHIPSYKLEQVLGNLERSVGIRRKLISANLTNPQSMENLPYVGYNYKQVVGACCENVIGYMPIPVGVAGPLLLDGDPYYVPMSTTEGCLVASTNRGCSALMKAGGINSYVVGDGMTRGPVLRLPGAADASSLKLWLDDSTNFSELTQVFDSTSRFARLKSLHTAVAGRLVYVRFCADTGDAMGMNMLSKVTRPSGHVTIM
jgi:hydroxymethylglutaryl-CoA reductase (NADPH)